MLEVYFEAKYDRRQATVGIPLNNEVVVKRSSIPLDSTASFEELVAKEGQKIFAADSGAASGCNHRMEITLLKLHGANFSSLHPIAVGVQMLEAA